jgi:N-acetylneuraminic acid mutarotase
MLMHMMRRRLEVVGAFLVAALATSPAAAQAPGEWSTRAQLLVPNSEFAVAEADGRIYVMGGYPPDRVTSRVVQVYDVARDSWSLGPELPAPNNHGMAASVGGRIYLIGGQTSSAGGDTFVDTVFELDPAVGLWVERAPMPTRRSAGVAVAHDGRIYVAGGRPPRGHDFAVYDPVADRWETLPDLPTQRNHLGGGVIDRRIHVVGGRLEAGFRSEQTAAHEVFDPETGAWSRAAPMLRPRSGLNVVVANGCLHAWGGESAAGMFPDHDVYDPRADSWTRLTDLPTPLHGVVGAAFVDGLIFAPGGGTQVGGSSGSLHHQVYRPRIECD